jgi:hypothetical protein
MLERSRKREGLRVCRAAWLVGIGVREYRELEMLDPLGREALRRVLIHDQADRDAISSQLLRYRDERGDDWADIIDMLTMYPEARQKVARLLGEISSDVSR